jgi:hypothetical protein
MPYSIVKVKDKYYVKDKATGTRRPKGGYATKAEADKYLKALYSNVSDAKKSVALPGDVSPLSKRDGCEFVAVRSMREPEQIEGVLALWGSPSQRDCYGTYFDRDKMPDMDLDFLPIPLRYAHGQDDSVGKAPIGKIVKVWLDDAGIKFRAILDKAHAAYSRIASEIREGKLATSSGTQEYLADFDDNGRFVSWPVGEVSLTDKPCEPRMPAVATVRSMPDKRIQLQVRPVEPCEDCPPDEPTARSGDDQASQLTSPEQLRESNVTDLKRDSTMRVKSTRADKPIPAKPASEPMLDDAGEVPTKRGGLTLEMLGLDATATPQDVYAAVCELLGGSAAEAYFDSIMGPEDTGLEVDPEEDDQEDMLAEPDTRPEQTSGDDPEDITTGRSTDLRETFRKALGKQADATKPRHYDARDLKIARLEAESKTLRRQLASAPVEDKPTAGANRNSFGNRSHNFDAREPKFEGANATDLAYAIKTLAAANKPISDDLVRATAEKIGDEMEKGTVTGADPTVRYMSPFRSASDVRSMDIKALRGLYSRRANEVMGDGNTGFGSNYVGVFYDTALWLKVRAMPIWRQLEARGMEEKVIPVGYSSDVIPLEGADFSWYRVPETVDVDATGRPKINITPSQAGTSSTTLTVRTLGALVYYSVLLEEDSIVPMAAELNRKANIEAQEQIEYVLFNGDTATGTGNLNLKNGTVSASTVTNYTVADGMLKTAIIANSGAAARAASGLSDLDFQLLFGLLGNNGITGSDPTKLMFAVDPQTGLAMDRLPIVKTQDINSAATVEKGHATEMYAVPIFRSGQIALADSTGYIDSVTAANNKFGRILCIRPDQWVVGFKRQVTMEFFRDVPGQSNGMVITLRLGLQTRDSTQAASASYNVTIK